MTAALKPTFYFMKMNGCSACVQFDQQMFQQLLKDPEVRQAVTLEQVVFGRGDDGVVYSLDDEFPDFRQQITYAPYLWLGRGYDESQGYHLRSETMHDKKRNLRQDGVLYSYRMESTYPELREWILSNARRFQGNEFRARKTTSRR